jgi:hypothetical protein
MKFSTSSLGMLSFMAIGCRLTAFSISLSMSSGFSDSTHL